MHVLIFVQVLTVDLDLESLVFLTRVSTYANFSQEACYAIGSAKVRLGRPGPSPSNFKTKGLDPRACSHARLLSTIARGGHFGFKPHTITIIALLLFPTHPQPERNRSREG